MHGGDDWREKVRSWIHNNKEFIKHNRRLAGGNLSMTQRNQLAATVPNIPVHLLDRFVDANIAEVIAENPFPITKNDLFHQQEAYLNKRTLNNYDFDCGDESGVAKLIQQRESRKNLEPAAFQVHSVIPKDPTNRYARTNKPKFIVDPNHIHVDWRDRVKKWTLSQKSAVLSNRKILNVNFTSKQIQKLEQLFNDVDINTLFDFVIQNMNDWFKADDKKNLYKMNEANIPKPTRKNQLYSKLPWKERIYEWCKAHHVQIRNNRETLGGNLSGPQAKELEGLCPEIPYRYIYKLISSKIDEWLNEIDRQQKTKMINQIENYANQKTVGMHSMAHSSQNFMQSGGMSFDSSFDSVLDVSNQYTNMHGGQTKELARYSNFDSGISSVLDKPNPFVKMGGGHSTTAKLMMGNVSSNVPLNNQGNPMMLEHGAPAMAMEFGGGLGSGMPQMSTLGNAQMHEMPNPQKGQFDMESDWRTRVFDWVSHNIPQIKHNRRTYGGNLQVKQQRELEIICPDVNKSMLFQYFRENIEMWMQDLTGEKLVEEDVNQMASLGGFADDFTPPSTNKSTADLPNLRFSKGGWRHGIENYVKCNCKRILKNRKKLGGNFSDAQHNELKELFPKLKRRKLLAYVEKHVSRWIREVRGSQSSNESCSSSSMMSSTSRETSRQPSVGSFRHGSDRITNNKPTSGGPVRPSDVYLSTHKAQQNNKPLTTAEEYVNQSKPTLVDVRKNGINAIGAQDDSSSEGDPNIPLQTNWTNDYFEHKLFDKNKKKSTQQKDENNNNNKKSTKKDENNNNKKLPKKELKKTKRKVQKNTFMKDNQNKNKNKKTKNSFHKHTGNAYSSRPTQKNDKMMKEETEASKQKRFDEALERIQQERKELDIPDHEVVLEEDDEGIYDVNEPLIMEWTSAHAPMEFNLFGDKIAPNSKIDKTKPTKKEIQRKKKKEAKKEEERKRKEAREAQEKKMRPEWKTKFVNGRAIPNPKPKVKAKPKISSKKSKNNKKVPTQQDKFDILADLRSSFNQKVKWGKEEDIVLLSSSSDEDEREALRQKSKIKEKKKKKNESAKKWNAKEYLNLNWDNSTPSKLFEIKHNTEIPEVSYDKSDEAKWQKRIREYILEHRIKLISNYKRSNAYFHDSEKRQLKKLCGSTPLDVAIRWVNHHIGNWIGPSKEDNKTTVESSHALPRNSRNSSEIEWHQNIRNFVTNNVKEIMDRKDNEGTYFSAKQKLKLKRMTNGNATMRDVTKFVHKNIEDWAKTARHTGISKVQHFQSVIYVCNEHDIQSVVSYQHWFNLVNSKFKVKNVQIDVNNPKQVEVLIRIYSKEYEVEKADLMNTHMTIALENVQKPIEIRDVEILSVKDPRREMVFYIMNTDNHQEIVDENFPQERIIDLERVMHKWILRCHMEDQIECARIINKYDNVVLHSSHVYGFDLMMNYINVVQYVEDVKNAFLDVLPIDEFNRWDICRDDSPGSGRIYVEIIDPEVELIREGIEEDLDSIVNDVMEYIRNETNCPENLDLMIESTTTQVPLSFRLENVIMSKMPIDVDVVLETIFQAIPAAVKALNYELDQDVININCDCRVPDSYFGSHLARICYQNDWLNKILNFAKEKYPQPFKHANISKYQNFDLLTIFMENTKEEFSEFDFNKFSAVVGKPLQMNPSQITLHAVDEFEEGIGVKLRMQDFDKDIVNSISKSVIANFKRNCPKLNVIDIE